MKPVIIIAIAFVLLIPLNVSAETIYPSLSNRVDDPPSYCFVKPSDTTNIPKYEIQKWEVEVEEAVNDWKTKLQNAESGNKSLWDITYLGSGTSPLSGCDFPIHVKPWSNSPSNWFNSLGVFFYTFIDVYFLGWVSCVIDDEDASCYNWSDIRPPSEIGGTTRHEIGHSLGLGHYSTDNDNTINKWLRQNTLPSIMVGGLGTDKNWRTITNIDVAKVRSLYGDKGFYAFSVGATIPVPQPSVPTPQPIAPIFPIFPFESVSISSPVVVVDRYSTQYVKVFGDIHEDIFQKGHKVYLKITKPNLTEELLTISTTNKGHFEVTLSFDHNDRRGFYTISAIYLEHTDREMDVVFEVLSKGKQSQQMMQIGATQSSGVTSDDPDGDGIKENDFCPNKAETFNGYQDGDGCPDTNPLKDSDGDGIIDLNDSCPYSPETFNGLNDNDGCPDTIDANTTKNKNQIQNEAEDAKRISTQVIESRYAEIKELAISLRMQFDKPDAKKKIDEGWKIREIAMEKLEEAKKYQTQGYEHMDSKDYKNAYDSFQKIYPVTDDVKNDLDQFSNIIDDANKIETSQVIVYEPSNSNGKFCFLFWCW